MFWISKLNCVNHQTISQDSWQRLCQFTSENIAYGFGNCGLRKLDHPFFFFGPWKTKFSIGELPLLQGKRLIFRENRTAVECCRAINCKVARYIVRNASLPAKSISSSADAHVQLATRTSQRLTRLNLAALPRPINNTPAITSPR